MAKLGQPEKFTAQQMIDALILTKGMVALTAKQLRCSQNTVRRYIREYPSVKQALIDTNVQTGDEVELVLYNEAVKEKNITALIFLAKTKFKDRGYTERVEHVIFNADQLKRFEDIALKDGRTAAELFEDMIGALASELETGSPADAQQE